MSEAGEREASQVALRRALHAQPDPSGDEERTARRIATYLEAHAPDRWVQGLGGQGFAVEYRGAEAGPRVMIRADLDALPIPETITLAHGSDREDLSHKCGHDGHMAIVAGLAPSLSEQRPARGSVVLLFQPAEETGEGAARVLATPAYASVAPDMIFALHNLPGFPAGSVVVRTGPFASASSGLIVELQGETSHAAEPHRGNSPALAVASLIHAFAAAPQRYTALHEAAQVTVIHARVGEVAFGTSPGAGVVMATLRAHEPAVMGALSEQCVDLAKRTAEAAGLTCTVRWTESFPATVNNAEAVKVVERCAEGLGLDVIRPEVPFPWSEDFGHFTAGHPGALFGLGAGLEQPALHHPSYDFPDALLAVGSRMFLSIIRDILGSQ